MPFIGSWPGSFIPTTMMPGQDSFANVATTRFNIWNPGEQSEEMSLPYSSLDEAISILKELPSNYTFNEMNSIERQALQKVQETYVTPARAEEHTSWYYANMGSPHKKGYGTAFAVMHRALKKQIENIVGPTFQMPMLIPGEAIPDELLFGSSERQISAIPKYLTLEGEDMFGQRASLNTIDNLDKLGCLLSFLDRRWHMDLGGDMRRIDTSITNKLFGPLHRSIDSIIDQWLETEKGKSWKNKNPNHHIFSLTEEPMTYSVQFFDKEDNGCSSGSSPDALCILLAELEQTVPVLNDMTRDFNFRFSAPPVFSNWFNGRERNRLGISGH